MITAAGDGAYLVHCLLHDCGEGIVESVGCLAVLEVDIRILGRASQIGVLRVHGMAAEKIDFLPVDKGPHRLVVDHIDGIHL